MPTKPSIATVEQDRPTDRIKLYAVLPRLIGAIAGMVIFNFLVVSFEQYMHLFEDGVEPPLLIGLYIFAGAAAGERAADNLYRFVVNIVRVHFGMRKVSPDLSSYADEP